MTWLHRALRLLLALSGLVVAAAGAGVTLMARGPGPGRLSVAAAGPMVAWLLVLAAAALVTAGVVAWLARPGSVLALVAFWGAAAWLAPELAVSPTVSREARTLGLLIAPLVVPLLVHLPARTLRADRGPARAAIAALYLATALAMVGHVLTWDPLVTIVCRPVCSSSDNAMGWFLDMRASVASAAAVSWVSLAAGVAVTAWAIARLRGRGAPRSTDRFVLIPAVATGAAMAGWALAGAAADPRGVVPDASVAATVMLGIAVIALGSGIAWVRFDEGRLARGVRGLVEVLDAGAGTRSLGETLATLLHDPTVRVAYPVDGGGCVDDQGGPVAIPVATHGRDVTPIERAGMVIALVEHAAGLDPDLISREIGAAARLAVDNERLAALLRAQVRELQASRERIVEAGDAARGRLERDLHDGAQQRLLAVSYELRLAQAAAASDTPERRAALDAAVTEIDRALAELRELAHGIWPAVLAEAGLEAALGSLADEAPIPVTLDAIPEQRFPARTEAAAYLAVTEALRRAMAGGAAGLVISARQVDDRLELEARAPGLLAPGPWLRVDDRVGAAGGRSAVFSDRSVGTLLTVELPCA